MVVMELNLDGRVEAKREEEEEDGVGVNGSKFSQFREFFFLFFFHFLNEHHVVRPGTLATMRRIIP